jgi:hypothetical protein
MIPREAIDEALQSHAAWKRTLHEAIASRQSDLSAEELRRDDLCQLGKWLHGLSPEERAGNDFPLVFSLHARFHQISGSVLAHALAGNVETALRMLEFNSEYGLVSGKLVLALNDWKSRLPV